MAGIGGGPTPEDWKKMSRQDKIAYFLFVGFVFGVISCFLVEKMLG